MKKKLLVFLLTICILISFVACSAREEPVITSSYEDTFAMENLGETTASSEETAPEQTMGPETETEATDKPPSAFVYANNVFPSIKYMVDGLKNGKVIPYGDFSDDTWLEVDLDRIYELSNLPEDYYEGLVEWSGKNSYMIYYHNVNVTIENLETAENLDICFEPLENCEELEKYMNGWISPWDDVEECLARFSNVRISTEESEYGTVTVWTYDTSTVIKDLVFKRLNAYEAEGNISFVYAQSIYSGGKKWNYLFNYSGDVQYAIIHTGNLPLETLLSLKPVKVEQ